MELTLDQKRAMAMASARARATEAEPAPAEATMEMPAFDAMGNPTGATTQVAGAKEGPAGPGIMEAFGRGGVQGATLGGADELQAGVTGAAAAATGGQFDFDKRLKEAQAGNKAAFDAHPWAYTGGQVAGGIAGMIPAVKFIPGAAKALGFIGRSLATRSLAAGTSGAGLGAVQSYLGTDGSIDDPKRMEAVPSGTVIGGGLGAAGPVVGQALGAGARALGNALMPGRTVPGVGKAAGRLLAEDVEAAGGALPIKQRLSELGPDAMLLDASPSFEGRAQGFAVRPETREIIVDPIKARDAGKNARLRGDLDETLGPAQVPSEVEAKFAASRERLEPRYGEELNKAPAFNPDGLWRMVGDMQTSAKGQMQRYLQQAEDLIAPMREVRGQGKFRAPDDSPEGLMATRKGLDGLIAKVLEDPQAQKEGVTRALTSIRQAVDDQMRTVSPDVKVLDRAYGSLAKQSEALDLGGRVLAGEKTALRPAELQSKMDAMIPAERRALAVGTRSEIDRMVGTKANDLVALKDAVKSDGDWNRLKLEQVFGKDEAAKVFNSVDREAAFEAAYRRIDQNSMTEMRRQSAEGVKPRGESSSSGDTGTVIAGAVGGPKAAALAMGMRGLRAANNSVNKAADIARNMEAAGLLVRPGYDENAKLVEALARNLAAGKTTERLGVSADKLGQMLALTQGEQSRKALPKSLQFR